MLLYRLPRLGESHGLGGSMELVGPSAGCNSGSFDPFSPSYVSGCNIAFDGYFYVTSMVDQPTSVPGPIPGAGLPGLIERWPSRLVATAAENRLTEHHASGAIQYRKAI